MVMMSYDERIVFNMYMDNGYKCEVKGNYEFAITRYTDAYNVAKTANDSAQKDALNSITRCQQKLEMAKGGRSK